jgi:hypothetical protein
MNLVWCGHFFPKRYTENGGDSGSWTINILLDLVLWYTFATARHPSRKFRSASSKNSKDMPALRIDAH